MRKALTILALLAAPCGWLKRTYRKATRDEASGVPRIGRVWLRWRWWWHFLRGGRIGMYCASLACRPCTAWRAMALLAASALLLGACASLSSKPDGDGDGVPDFLDRCPKEPGPLENMGCPPPPPTCPATCPEASACTDPAKGCEPIPPPSDKPVCRCDSGGPCCGCYHWPPSPASLATPPIISSATITMDTATGIETRTIVAAGWQEATCPAGEVCVSGQCEAAPPPQCPATCPPGQACVDPAKGCEAEEPGPTPTGCVPPASDLAGWEGAGRPLEPNAAGKLTEPRNDVVRAAIAALGGAETGGPRCGKNQDESLDLVAAEMRKRGICAGRWGDAIAYVTADGTWVEHHAVRSSDGCLLDGDGPNVYVGTWRYKGDEAFPVGDSCPDPVPNLAPGAWKLACKMHTVDTADCTHTTVGTLAYCQRIGMGEMGGLPRAGCPFRKERHPERVVCEALAGELVVEACTPGATCQKVAPTMFRTSGGGGCRMCNGDRSVCSTCF